MMASVGATALVTSAVTGTLGSGASTLKAHSTSTTLTVPWSPGSVPDSVLPFYTGAECTTTNIAYWNLMYRPGYWFGLGSSIAEQPDLSSLREPVYSTSNGDTVVTLSTKNWKWTKSNTTNLNSGNSETLNAQDVIFWLNMDKAQSKQGANAACGYVPGMGIPDQVKSVTAPDGLSGSTVRITFTGLESRSWLTNNELSQIQPMPTAWDTTNGTNDGGCSSESWSAVATSGNDQCSKVFDYLSGLSINDSLWDWANGPYRQISAGIASGKPDGNNRQGVNTNYGGPVKPSGVLTIVYKPYASTQAEIADLQAGKLSTGYVEPTNVTKSPGPGLAGKNLLPHLTNFKTVGAVNWGVYYWMFNFGNQNSTYPSKASWVNLVNQQYIRAALQETENQAQIIKTVFNGYGVATYSAIPTLPAADAASLGSTRPKYTYSNSAASALLAAHGWKTSVTPAVCNVSNCGTSDYPISKGTKLKLEVLAPSGSVATTNFVNNVVASAKKSGIQLTAKFQTANDVQKACFSGAAAWQICAYGGWIYAPDYYPSGEVLFAAGSGSNSGGYTSSEMDGLVQATTTKGDLGLGETNPTYGTSFAQFTADDLPFLWTPTPTGFGERLKSTIGAQAPNPLGNFNPEYITSI
jgi:peptide/nickel transport system substrate-binding protein